MHYTHSNCMLHITTKMPLNASLHIARSSEIHPDSPFEAVAKPTAIIVFLNRYAMLKMCCHFKLKPFMSTYELFNMKGSLRIMF